MITPEPLIVILVKLVDCIPMPPAPGKRGRGRPQFYSERLFLKALVIMIVQHLHKVHELLAVLDEPTAEMQMLRSLLSEGGRYPTRRTWERRLKALPASLPAQISCLGRYLVVLMQPWLTYGRAVAIDSTILLANGGVWHQKQRAKGEVPHTSIDTEAHWTKSGRHGWCYGWKLHLVATVAAVWIPLAADLTAANVADNEAALALLAELPAEVRFVTGDLHYNAPNVRVCCERSDRILVATRVDRIRTPTMAWKCAASSTSCAHWRSKISTSTSRASSTATARCPPRACATPNAGPWAQSFFINWRSCIAFRPPGAVHIHLDQSHRAAYSFSR